MSISATSLGLNPNGLLGTDDPIAKSNAKRDARFAELLSETDEAKAALAEVTGGGIQGYWAWKMKKLREDITSQVMSELNMTPEKLAAMPAEERLAMLKKIEDMVAERLKLAMQEEMKKKENTLLGFNATATAILSAQDIGQGLPV